MYLLGMIVTFFLGMITITLLFSNNMNEYIEQKEESLEKQEELLQENVELKKTQIENQNRENKLIEKMQKIENVIREGKKTNEFDTIVLAKIEQELYEKK